MTNPSKRIQNGLRGSRSAPPTNAFQPGHKGGPGKPRLTEAEVLGRKLVADFQPEAIGLLIEHARNIKDPRLSLDALKHLTAWLPKLQLEVSGKDGAPVEVVGVDPRRLSTEVVMAITAQLQKSEPEPAE